jgi:coproporphyrinogen III oxidase-like Fe-S oxidoreductase
MHWGGGTPNYLNLHQVERLWQVAPTALSTLLPDAEISIEVNPRQLDRNFVMGLRDLGFNRISFGIQDFNPQSAGSREPDAARRDAVPGDELDAGSRLWTASTWT